DLSSSSCTATPRRDSSAQSVNWSQRWRRTAPPSALAIDVRVRLHVRQRRALSITRPALFTLRRGKKNGTANREVTPRQDAHAPHTRPPAQPAPDRRRPVEPDEAQGTDARGP